MAQNIISLLELKARQDALPDEQKPSLSLDDLIYAVHGEGSDRDTVWRLAEFIAFLVANEKFDVLKLVKDSSNDITIKWDSGNNEFVIWERANTGTVAVPKLHVHGTLEVEKDATIRADVSITKTLTVANRADFNGGFTVIKNLYATDYAETYCRLKTARLNLKNTKSYFTVSEDSNINTLIAGVSEQIEVAEGDIVTVCNGSTSAVMVNLGTRPGSGGIETKSTTLNALCAMQFMCCLKQTTQVATYVQWAPLGNATVTWA